MVDRWGACERAFQVAMVTPSLQKNQSSGFGEKKGKGGGGLIINDHSTKFFIM